MWKCGVTRDLHGVGLGGGRVPVFIRSFLTNRVFGVRLGSACGGVYEREMGFPQGSALSVTLFVLEINSVADVIPASFGGSLFVDDFSITCSSGGVASVERRLQLCLSGVEGWAGEGGFGFSGTKAVCMRFCDGRGLHPDLALAMYGSQIPVVSQAGFLGVVFDRKLKFGAHVDCVRRGCEGAMNLLGVVAGVDWGADRGVLVRLCRSFVRSGLECGCTVFGSARESCLGRLGPVQGQDLGVCLGAFGTSPVRGLCVGAGGPPLCLGFVELCVRCALRLRGGPDNPAYDVVFGACLCMGDLQVT